MDGTRQARQLGLFNPVGFDKKIHVVGIGATGSHIVECLAKMGIRSIVAYDFDIIEPQNIGNQIYYEEQIGKLKTEALKECIKRKNGFDIEIVNEKVDKIENCSGILFLCTDSMDTQKDIFHSTARLNQKLDLVVETRMGLEMGRIYSFDPRNKIHIKKWLETCYSDSEAAEPVCTMRSIATTAAMLSAIAAHKVVQQYGKSELRVVNETIIALDGSTLSLKTW